MGILKNDAPVFVYLRTKQREIDAVAKFIQQHLGLTQLRDNNNLFNV
jgi:hypothetical protein